LSHTSWMAMEKEGVGLGFHLDAHAVDWRDSDLYISNQDLN